MHSHIKEQVLAALRSGDYAQTTDAASLHIEVDGQHQFCVLGVIVDQAIKAGVDVPTHTVKTMVSINGGMEDGYVYIYGKEGRAGVLPEEVADWAGLTCDPIVTWEDGERLHLYVLNDQHGLSLSELADVIDEQL